MTPRRATRHAALLFAVTALVAVSGCADDDSPPVATSGSVPASSRSTVTTAPASTPASGSSSPAPTSPDAPLTIAFVGDMHFENQIGERLAADPTSVWGDTAAVTSAADLTFGNLETAIGTTGSPEPKTYTFRAPPTAFEALRDAGFDAVSMANNHAVDFGAPALAETLAAIKATDVKVAGVGANAAEAYAPVFLEAKGRRIAFLAASQIAEHTLAAWTAGVASPGIAAVDDQFVAAVAAASTQADLTIVYLHWGVENTTCASETQETTADQLVAAGADIVVGSHAHKLMGAGWKGDSFVSYGLGNYLWYVQNNEETTRTGVFTVTVDGTTPVSYAYAPGRIAESGIPEPMNGVEAVDAQAKLDGLRGCTDLAGQP